MAQDSTILQNKEKVGRRQERKKPMKLGTLGRTEVHLHFSYLILFVAVMATFVGSSANWVNGLVEGITVFGMVTVLLFGHEMAHIKAAEYLGLSQGKSTLFFWGLGGIASLPELEHCSPSDEMLVAAAGPAFNLTLGAAAILLVDFDWLQVAFNSEIPYPALLISYFFVINLTAGIFNLVPAFPMDGGRILRGGLNKMGLSKLRATQWACWVSWVVAAGLVGLAIWMAHPWFVFIAVFTFFASQVELSRVKEDQTVL